MKIKLICLKIIIYTLFVLSFISCDKSDSIFENNQTSLNKTTYEKTLNNVLLEMKILGDLKGKIVVFDIKNLSKEDYKKYITIEKNSDKIFEFNKGFNSNYKYLGDNYTVTCTYGDGSSETTNCGSDVGCAGQATWDCLDNGGCATICNSKITYYPIEINLNKPKTSLDSILSKIENIGESNKQAIAFNISLNNNLFTLNNINYININNNKDLNYLKALQKKGNIDINNRTWVVTCYDGDGNVTSETTCYIRDCAGAAVIQCTEGGGCAEVCQIYARYIPNNYFRYKNL